MDTHFELVSRVFVYKGRLVDRELALFRWQGDRSHDISTGTMRRFDNGTSALVNDLVIISQNLDANTLLRFLVFFWFLCGRHVGNDKERSKWTPPLRVYLRILVITPAPTVRPPSRMAKRCCSSIATGTINLIVILTVSPGITISAPDKVTSPVTSVVRM